MTNYPACIELKALGLASGGRIGFTEYDKNTESRGRYGRRKFLLRTQAIEGR